MPRFGLVTCEIQGFEIWKSYEKIKAIACDKTNGHLLSVN